MKPAPRDELGAPGVVDRNTFQAELDAVRAWEKAHAKEGDAIAGARRLPMVEMDGATPLIGERGDAACSSPATLCGSPAGPLTSTAGIGQFASGRGYVTPIAATSGRSHQHGEPSAMAVTIYGIKNCDTMKKARAWLEKHGIDYDFHDYKTAGLERRRLERWEQKVGWEKLLNRSGMTFRKLPDRDKKGLDANKAMALMLEHPSVIKRPVLDLGGGKLLVGFTPELYDESIPVSH